VKRVPGKLLKKIPAAEVKPISGKTVMRFMEAVKTMPKDPVAVKRKFDDVSS